MANSIYLGGGIKSAFCGGNVKEIWQGVNKLWGGGGYENFVRIGDYDYPVKKIGNRLWTTENLDFILEGYAKLYYNNDEQTYGRNGKKWNLLYDNPTTQAIVLYINSLQNGWRVAVYNDYLDLQSTCNNDSSKARATSGWDSGFSGTDDFGFAAVPNGYSHGGGFYNGGKYAFYRLPDIAGSNFFIDATQNTFRSTGHVSSSGMALRLCKDA